MTNMFRDADINKDGFLSFDELYNLFSKIDSNVSQDELMALMSEIDENEDGRLDINEFVALMSMDPESMQKDAQNVLIRMKRVKQVNPQLIARQFKGVPSHFTKSFLQR